MRVCFDYFEFLNVAGVILDRDRVQELGFENNDSCASFYEHNVQKIIDFCKTNPQYHIVTSAGPDILYNRYDSRGDMFQLADGDPDPNYMLDSSRQREQLAKASAELAYKLLAALNSGKRSEDTKTSIATDEVNFNSDRKK